MRGITMVRKYKPEVITERGYGVYFDVEYSTATMTESPEGEWVKLSTFEDETKRLRAIINRLEERIDELQECISFINIKPVGYKKL
jgi:hypothetical protein